MLYFNRGDIWERFIKGDSVWFLMVNTNFGVEKKKGLYDSYIGKWVIVYPQGINIPFSGKLVEIKEGYGLLNPFQGGEFKEGKLVRRLVNDDGNSLVPLFGSAIEPTTEEYLGSYCETMNKKSEEEKLKSQEK